MKPNIIIVMTDQQRADLRRSRGYELDTMPFLDQWAQGGADFCSAYTPNPTCMPARVSMFTGRYIESHRVRTNHNEEDACYRKGLLEILKENGYTTALCGKNHTHYKPEDFDFAEQTGHMGYEGETNLTEQERQFADFLCATSHRETYSPSPFGIEVQHPYRNVSSAFKFIDSIAEERPFFAWVSFAEPHNPYQVPEPYFDMFPPETLPALHADQSILQQKGQRFVWLRKQWENVLGDDIDKKIGRARSNYHGMLRLIDDQFKRLIEGLRERELEDKTIVIFVSDHGDFAGEYGLIRKGPDLPDLLCRIPFIWRGPGVAAQGKLTGSFVNLTDIFPTLCDMLGVEIPFGVQGKSIRPLLEGDVPAELKKEFEKTYSESGFSGLYWKENDALDPETEGALNPRVTFDCLNTWTQCGQVRALWKGNYHIQFDMMGSGYLYDLSKDPYECNNLWGRDEYSAVCYEMLKELTAEMLKASDPLPAPRRRYRTKIHPKGYWYQNYEARDPGIR